MSPVTHERLKELLTYEPETGVMTWKAVRGRAHGRDHAGYVGPDGYWRIQVGGRMWLLHRLAWLYMTGEQPPPLIDHVDRDPANNRWANLRKADKSHNNANSGARNPTGFKGVRRHHRKYAAQITGRYLGLFDTAEEASAAYEAAARLQFGEFARAA